MEPEQFVSGFDPEGCVFANRRMRLRIAEFFYQRINFVGEGGCWLWEGGHNAKGYALNTGMSNMFGTTLAHRQLFLAFSGQEVEEVATVKELDHLCRVPGCVRPDHLDAVSTRENVHRSLAHKKTCVNGHPYTAENRIHNKTSEGKWSRCRLCHAERERLRANNVTPEHLKEGWEPDGSR